MFNEESGFWKMFFVEYYDKNYAKYITANASACESMYNEMADKFAATLLDEVQRKAFNSLRSIADVASKNQHDAGVMLGIDMAEELREILDDPASVLHKVASTYPSLYKMFRQENKAMEDYFRQIAELHAARGTDNLRRKRRPRAVD